MADIFKVMSTAKDFLSKLLNIKEYEIDITKAAKANDVWKVEASSTKDVFKHHIVVDDNLEVQSYEKREVGV
ncbi:hypothetical protein HYT92_03580 [Candidatus Pacearchaeota archaeon]|nr:hypothetical protein [Candidatus Pacearchaeota archaeon]